MPNIHSVFTRQHHEGMLNKKYRKTWRILVYIEIVELWTIIISETKKKPLGEQNLDNHGFYWILI